MKSNEALATYEAEYTRLFESLYKAHRLEEELTEKCRLLKVYTFFVHKKKEKLLLHKRPAVTSIYICAYV